MTKLDKNDINIIAEKLNAKVININDVDTIKINDDYYRITLVEGLGGYVIEYAETLDDAKNNLFEDCDVIDNNVDSSKLIDDIVSYIKDIN